MEDKRRFRRVAFKGPVQFRTKSQGEPAACVAYDLSERGIRLNSSDFIPAREEMVLTLQMDFGVQIDLPGRVIWVQRVPHAENYHIGLEFVQPADNQVLHELQEYIESH